MLMDPGIDTGPILTQREIEILPNETAGTLGERLANLGATLLVETLPGYLSGNIQPQAQDETRSTYAPMLSKEEGRLNFSHPAADLERRVRAFQPWPGTFMDWQGQPLKILRAHTAPGNNLPPGQRCMIAGLPAVATSAGCLVFDVVQLAGKKAMPGQEFLRGSRLWLS